jgi:excisionase family DNA binding protein
MKWGSHGYFLPVRRSATVVDQGFKRVTDRLQIDDKQETFDLIAICHPFVTLAAHHARMSELDQLLTPQDLANYLDVPLNTLYQWRHHGRGPVAFRVGKHIRYRRRDVEAWIRERIEPAPHGPVS